jgi:hypothetical protein
MIGMAPGYSTRNVRAMTASSTEKAPVVKREDCQPWFDPFPLLINQED